MDKQLTLSLLHDATVLGDIHYYDVCKVPVGKVTIAYNNDPGYFEVDHETQTMVEIPLMPANGWSYIPWDWEIIKPFLDHYSLTPTWIDCNYTWGWFDKGTRTWTGAVGKVLNCDTKFLLKLLFRLRGMRQTWQWLILPAPMAGPRLLCVHMQSAMSLATGGHDTPRRQLDSGTWLICFNL